MTVEKRAANLGKPWCDDRRPPETDPREMTALSICSDRPSSIVGTGAPTLIEPRGVDTIRTC